MLLKFFKVFQTSVPHSTAIAYSSRATGDFIAAFLPLGNYAAVLCMRNNFEKYVFPVEGTCPNTQKHTHENTVQRPHT